MSKETSVTMKILYWLHRTVLNFLKPMLEVDGKIHMPFSRKLVQGPQYYSLRPHLKPGTILLTRIRGELTTLMIPGFFTHAAIISPRKDKSPSEGVVQAEGVGVIWSDLVTFMTSKDYVCALEPAFLEHHIHKHQIMERAAAIAQEQLGKPYNYAFDFHLDRQHAFYCSELVWWSYDRACKEYGVASPFIPYLKFGCPTITPDDISKASLVGKFKVIWDSRNPIPAE